MRTPQYCKSLVWLMSILFVTAFSPGVKADTVGSVAGTVHGADGQGLKGANVVIQGTNLTTVTDAKGNFVITAVPDGDYAVQVTTVGFQPQIRRDIRVNATQTTLVDVNMTIQATAESEQRVKIQKTLLHPHDTPTLYQVTARQEKKVIQQASDLFQANALLQTQPGMTVDGGGLHVRGSRANQIAYLLEGIPITEPLTGNFGTNKVTVGMANFELFTGGYLPEFGNGIGGAINEIKKTGAQFPGKNFMMMFGGNGYKGNYNEIGGTMKNGGSYYLGGYGFASDIPKNKLTHVKDGDAVAKVVISVGKKDKLTFLENAGTARYTLGSTHTMTDNSVVTPLMSDNSHQGYNIASVTWNHQFNAASFLTVRPYKFYSSNMLDVMGQGFFADYHSDQTGGQVEYTNHFSPRSEMKVGVHEIVSRNYYHGYRDSFASALGLPSSLDPYSYISSATTKQTSFFIQQQFRPTKKMTWEVGARYDRMLYNKKANPDESESAISPRLGLSYQTSKKNVLRASWGKFTQFAPSRDMERIYSNPGWDAVWQRANIALKPEKATSFDIGAEHQFSNTVVGRITPFYRQYKDMLQYRSENPLTPGAPPYVYANADKGTSRGVEFNLNKKLAKNWDGWLSYTFQKTRATSLWDPTKSTFVDWDQRHTLAAVLGYNVEGWRVNLQAEYGSGLPFSNGMTDSLDNLHRMSKHTVISLGLNHDFGGGALMGSSVYMNIYNLTNSGKMLHQDPGLTPDSFVNPRSLTAGVTRRF